MKYDKLKEQIKKSVEEFKKIDKKETIRVISHLDCDGIAACSILIKAFNRDNRKYSISIIQQLDKKIVDELKNEDYSFFFFSDLGSGYASEIYKNFKKVFILDHHQMKDKFANTTHINPHFFGIDGNKEISGAGLAYLFAKELNEKNKDMAHIAVIGAIGDIQENNGFLKLNNEILQEALKQGTIKLKKGLRVFGGYTKPLHKVLEYSSDIYIPGVTGSETNSIKFLQDIGINPKNGKEWVKINELSDEEMQRLIAAVVMKRNNQTNPEDIIGYSYILTKETYEQLKEAKEFSTILNACGRLNNASLGIGCCLDDKKKKKKAIENLSNYKKEIVNAINWYNKNKKNSNIIKEDGFIIINAQDNILSTITGTLASMLARNNEFKKGTLIMSMAQQMDNTTKVSLRCAGDNESDLMGIIKDITEKIDGEAGGHKDAAGAIIKTEDEEKFIEEARKILKEKKSQK